MKVVKYILENKEVLKFIGIAVLVLLLLRQCGVNTALKSEIKMVENVSNRNLNNYLAGRDTIKLERNKYNELVVSKLSYEYDINEISNTNKEIISKYTKTLNINNQLKDVNSLLMAQMVIKDSIINSSASIITLNDTSFLLNFTDQKNWDKYNWRTFNGSIEILGSSSTNSISVVSSKFDISQGIRLKAAILNNNGVSSLKISTTYHGVTFTDIENINLVNDKLNQRQTKKGGWSIGLGVGYGINLNNNQVISTGPSVGIGVFYSPKFLRF